MFEMALWYLEYAEFNKTGRFVRFCPAKGRGLDCLVRAPNGYREPIPWPKSRDEVWFSNVPHTRLVEDKGGQNWIKKDGEKFKFPGGGTQFIHGADSYLDQISEMVPDIAFGNHTRVVLDVGCGVASFGAFLLSRDVITMSIAPKDVHENQIQFALERGVPAMVAAIATRRLPYPSQAFDLLHCSRCRVNWTRDDGILLLEANRMLRAGGYFAWAAQPVYKHEVAQQEAWKEMENLTARICWKLVKKEGYLAIWRKPLNNSCYLSRSPEVQPPLCDPKDDPNSVWYVPLKACISQLLDDGSGSNITAWPARLHEPPPRLQGVEMDAYIAKDDLFRAETRFWNDIVEGYIRVFRWKEMNMRNVMDMRAGFGGFAAAIIDQKMNSWVMNVVPISGPNTLPVIYDRGLIGVAHDWCESFDTYPRTYDFLHAFGLFSIEHKRCNFSVILLEMDRILRPGGRAYIRDSKFITEEIKEITEAMGWKTELRDTAEGPYPESRVAFVVLALFAMTACSDGAWCVCRQDVSDSALQKSIDYACGAGADCSPINQNGACFIPNTVKSHCSYAVNSYFQRKGQTQQACDFAGAAAITQQDPSSNGCTFPASSSGAGISTGSNNGAGMGAGNGATPATSFGGGSGSGGGFPTPVTVNSTTPSSMTPTGYGTGGVMGGLAPSGNVISTDNSSRSLISMPQLSSVLVLILSVLVVLRV